MLELKNINMSFAMKGKFFQTEKRAVVIRDFDLTIGDDEIIAVVGESGCGKTTIGKIVTGLLAPTSGEVLFNGENIRRTKRNNKSDYRRNVQFIQQDSYAALNPVKTIHQSLCAAIEIAEKGISKEKKQQRLEELMGFVGLTPMEHFVFKYPHQLSGGQRQRVLMARALALNPKLIVADEPVSMIDVSLRIAILKLIEKLNRELKIAFIYITHDLATAKYIADKGRICVMYLGDIVELGNIDEVLFHPKHPYTQALVTAVPVPDPSYRGTRGEIPVKGMEMTKLTERGRGCSFAPRCPYATEECSQEDIPYVEINGVKVKCRNIEEVPVWT